MKFIIHKSQLQIKNPTAYAWNKIKNTTRLPRFDGWTLGRISMQHVSLNEVNTRIFTPYCNKIIKQVSVAA